MDADGDGVLAGLEVRGGVELGGQARALAVAEEDPVEPHRERGVDALEAQEGAAGARPVGREAEGAAVFAGGVGVGDPGRVDGERVDRVGVLRFAVGGVAVEVVHLPHRRDREGAPGRGVEGGVLEALGGVVEAGPQPEAPLAVEAERGGVGGQRRPGIAPPTAWANAFHVGEIGSAHRQVPFPYAIRPVGASPPDIQPGPPSCRALARPPRLGSTVRARLLSAMAQVLISARPWCPEWQATRIDTGFYLRGGR